MYTLAHVYFCRPWLNIALDYIVLKIKSLSERVFRFLGLPDTHTSLPVTPIVIGLIVIDYSTFCCINPNSSYYPAVRQIVIFSPPKKKKQPPDYFWPIILKFGVIEAVSQSKVIFSNSDFFHTRIPPASVIRDTVMTQHFTVTFGGCVCLTLANAV